jgi:hypothetical protein
MLERAIGIEPMTSSLGRAPTRVSQGNPRMKILEPQWFSDLQLPSSDLDFRSFPGNFVRQLRETDVQLRYESEPGNPRDDSEKQVSIPNFFRSAQIFEENFRLNSGHVAENAPTRSQNPLIHRSELNDPFRLFSGFSRSERWGKIARLREPRKVYR